MNGSKLKIVVVDVISHWGHNALNSEILSALQRAGCIIDFIGNESHRPIADGRGLNLVTLFKTEKKYLFVGPLFGRIRLVKTMREIAKIIDEKDYDIVLLSAFDELSMISWPRVRAKLLLLAHGNISGAANKIKRLALKRIASRAHILVFHEYIRTRALELGLPSVSVIGQGLASPYVATGLAALIDRIPADLRKFVSQGIVKLVFVPSGAKYSDELLRHLLLSLQMEQLCDRNKIHFIVKGGKPIDRRYVTTLPDHISTQQYQAIFQCSVVILLAYPPSFDYRLSAVFIECLSNAKPCVVSDIDSFRAVCEHFNYNPYFFDCQSLIRAIRESVDVVEPFYNKEAFELKADEILFDSRLSR